MRNRHGQVQVLLAAATLLAACSGNNSGTFQQVPGGAGGGTALSSYTSPVGTGGSLVGQGGAFAPNGGSSGLVGQGGAATTPVSGIATSGGTIAATGGSKATGNGGTVATTGGTKATTGGTVASTGGTVASTGGTTGAATGGTKASTGTSTAAQNIFTVGPFTGAGWVAGGTVDGTSSTALLTSFTNPTISGTTQTFTNLTNLCMSATIPALQSCSAAGVTCSATEKTAASKNYSEDWGGELAINTTTTEGTPKGTAFSNIAVTYTGTVTPASAPVRLQLQLADKSVYCYNGYSSGLQIALKDLVLNCWDTASTTTLSSANTANVTSVQLSVASGAAAVTIANLCMTNIVLDGSTGPVTTTTCTDTSTAANTLSGQTVYATVATTNASKSYILQSNWWGTYSSQAEAYSGLSFTVNGAGTFVNAATPLGYPSFFIGSYVGNTSAGSNLPKLVSSLTTVPTVYQWSGSTDVSHFNASYDVWFTASNAKVTAGNPGSGGAYLMVWMFMPSDQTPRGSMVEASVTIPGAPGTFQVWYDASGGSAPCVSYVANSKQSSMSFDLNEFIKHAVGKSYGVKNTQYLSIVFGGFEIWAGHNGLKLDKFCAQVN